MKLIVNEKQYNRLLNETRGYSKSAEDWAHLVTDEIMKYIFNIDDEDTLSMDKLKLKYGHKDFFKNLPIESININVFIDKIEGEDGGADASFVPHYAHIENGNLEDVEFNLDLELPETSTFENDYNTIRDYLFQMFTHELIHVYEWFKRGLKDPAERKDCMGLFTSGDLNGNIVERLSYLIYTQLSFEINAFIHQAGTMLRMREIKTYEDFKENLESLFIWDFVQAMLNFNPDEVLREVQTLDGEERELFNSIKLCYYSTKDEEGNTKIDVKTLDYTDERFIKDLHQKFKVRGEGMKRKLYRLASDIL